jgi:hypothetical protein
MDDGQLVLVELQTRMQASEDVIDDHQEEQCHHNNSRQLQEADPDISKDKLCIGDNEAEAGNTEQANQH